LIHSRKPTEAMMVSVVRTAMITRSVVAWPIVLVLR